ncbi:hypothetical protein B4589_001755 [Halolamina sp. CBA1230]|uniref:hypothetical protein n=1 Tax=Halolamina sp. CBA1230 TaxID=1853690 RepID=UPI00117B8F4C|nr:hypothetical protein [Halolamina sp. CBA1230]QKY19163.1 hypothetical protein B4589_001755 [Halolamina sp. CBA1230]
MTDSLPRVVVVALLLVFAGCGGAPGATETQSEETATPTEAPSTTTETVTATPQWRGGLLIVSPTNETEQPAVEYDPDDFGEVPTLNETVVAAARTNDTVTADLSSEELEAIDAFVDDHSNATGGTFPVRVGNRTVEVSIAREA